MAHHSSSTMRAAMPYAPLPLLCMKKNTRRARKRNAIVTAGLRSIAGPKKGIRLTRNNVDSKRPASAYLFTISCVLIRFTMYMCVKRASTITKDRAAAAWYLFLTAAPASERACRPTAAEAANENTHAGPAHLWLHTCSNIGSCPHQRNGLGPRFLRSIARPNEKKKIAGARQRGPL